MTTRIFNSTCTIATLQERFTALAEILREGSYDVVVVQEVWFQQHYDIIKADNLFLKHSSSILKQSSNPVCGFSTSSVLFGPRRTGMNHIQGWIIV